MAVRETNPQLEKLYDEGKHVYSISRANTINNCLYEAYNSYVLRTPKTNNVYGVLGTKIHDVLEKVVKGQKNASALSAALNEELFELDMLGLDFPKDPRGGNTVRKNWVADMTDFCKSFSPLKGEFTTEEFFLYKLSNDRYVQGYIDLIKHNNDGTISIFDWKTSSMFKNKTLRHHGRQLAMYKIAKEAQGEKVRSVAWIMLKYVEVKYRRRARNDISKSRITVKDIARHNLIKELSFDIECDLKEAGYSGFAADVFMEQTRKTNSLEFLPAEIRDKYEIRPCIRYYNVTPEIERECLDYINDAADRFESLDESNPQLFLPREFTRTNSLGKEIDDTFYCHALCNFRNSCKYIKEHDDWQGRLDKTDLNDDLF